VCLKFHCIGTGLSQCYSTAPRGNISCNNLEILKIFFNFFQGVYYTFSVAMRTVEGDDIHSYLLQCRNPVADIFSNTNACSD